jgi:DNA-directed RNA polymerase subunit M/transcription elongation factor TFIIS
MICKKCGEAFTPKPGKPGFANVCPNCTESPQSHAKKIEMRAADQKALASAERANKRSREEAEREKRELAAMGFEVVQRFRVEVPVNTKRQLSVVAERDTMRRIREAVESGTLVQPFRPADVNRALGIDYAGVFLPKHRVGNPGKFTQHFVRIERGLYRLK